MNQTNVTFRLETKEDNFEVESMVRDSFWNVYRPGCVEHYLLHQLRGCKDFVHDLDIVMEKNGHIIGQVAFVKAHIALDDGSFLPILTMGPFCVAHELKRQGYGLLLLDYALEEARKAGFGAICIEGNYDFYHHCGFQYGKDFHLRYEGLPEDVDASFFLCKELIPHFLDDISGQYGSPACYNVSEEAVDQYDQHFPYKEKLVLPGQLV